MPAAKRTRVPALRASSGNIAGSDDAAVSKATGKTWSAWIASLDAAGARALAHGEIAALLRTRHAVPAWWAQKVTVGYEQAIGRRVVGQKCSGDFAANASKTVALSARDLHAWLVDEDKRARWLDRSVDLRSATAPKSARFGFSDGSIAGAWITAKGETKSAVGISHDGLPDAATAARHKAFWQAALARLSQEIARAVR
jgi:hypothetical protein